MGCSVDHFPGLGIDHPRHGNGRPLDFEILLVGADQPHHLVQEGIHPILGDAIGEAVLVEQSPSAVCQAVFDGGATDIQADVFIHGFSPVLG